MHDLLIMGPQAWADSLERFAQYKRDTAISAKVVTIEDAQNGSGSDAPDRIKRRIEHEHRTDGVTMVLVVGDADRFPVRYIKATNTEWGTMWYASDLYYADLYDSAGSFDDWDADGDGIYAEMEFQHLSDGAKFNTDKVNLFPDVAVGRVPASSAAEAERYFDKVRSYEFAARESRVFGYPSSWFRNAILAAGPGFGGDADVHAVPLSDAGFHIVRRYQDDATWSGPGLQAKRHQELRKLLDQGAGFLHFRGHGNTGLFADWCWNQDVAALSNDSRLPIVVAMSCLTARFHIDKNEYLTAMGVDWVGSAPYVADRPQPAHTQAKHDKDSFAEEFLVRRTSGAIAYLGASHKFEHGGKTLGEYFLEAYRNAPKPPTIGSLWKKALYRFVQTDLGGGTIGMGPYYAFIHAHKVMLFGDPSLRVGGLAHHTWATGQGALDAALVQVAVG